MPASPRSALKRASRLQRSVTLASWWLLAQGALYLLLGQRLSDLTGLRYQAAMLPYIRLSAVGLLALGLFVNRAVREASRQYLAVDSLVLYFCGAVITAFSFRLHGNEVFWFEWASLALNAGFAAALILTRTRGTEMDAPGGLAARDAVQALRQAADWIKKGGNPSSTLAPIGEKTPTPKPAKTSEAMPHMD